MALDAKSCIHTNALTADCPPTMLKGPIRSFCAAPTCPADQIIRVQPYCEIIDRPSYLVNTNGTILCGHDAKPCLTPNALTGACPPGTRPGGLRDVCEQKSIMDFVPFTIRLMARPFCTSYPLFTQFSSFTLQNPFCGPSQLCHFLNSTSDECPPGMFRGDHKVVYVPDPDASECPSGYTGLPPFCMPYVGFGGATPDMINPNVIKSLIGWSETIESKFRINSIWMQRKFGGFFNFIVFSQVNDVEIGLLKRCWCSFIYSSIHHFLNEYRGVRYNCTSRILQHIYMNGNNT